jgi:hypothetical protein
VEKARRGRLLLGSIDILKEDRRLLWRLMRIKGYHSCGRNILVYGYNSTKI